MAKQTLTNAEALSLIQILVAVPLLVIGAYMLSPFYVILPESAAFGTVALASTAYVKVVGAFLFASGVGTAYGGIFNNSDRLIKIAVWACVSMYALLMVTRLVTIGFVPVIWVLMFALMGISAVLALTVRERG